MSNYWIPMNDLESPVKSPSSTYFNLSDKTFIDSVNDEDSKDSGVCSMFDSHSDDHHDFMETEGFKPFDMDSYPHFSEIRSPSTPDTPTTPTPPVFGTPKPVSRTNLTSRRNFGGRRLQMTQSNISQASPTFADHSDSETPTGLTSRRCQLRSRKRFNPDTPTDTDLLTPVKRLSVRNGNENKKCPLTPISCKYSNHALQRFNSEIIVKSAMLKGEQCNNLIGDFSSEFRLPLEPKSSKNNDLNMISSSTLMKLLRGDFDDTIDNYIVVDCRYPFEFNGGHIKGALNLHSKQLIIENLIQQVRSNGKTVIIFHCEFSSERGPKMSRFLRNKDRDMNSENYPHLMYPEIYILKDGYKAFYNNDDTLCEPKSYLPMLDAGHKEQLRLHRSLRVSEKRNANRLRF